jgi:hypothetical protein
LLGIVCACVLIAFKDKAITKTVKIFFMMFEI